MRAKRGFFRTVKGFFWSPKFGWHTTYMLPYLWGLSTFYEKRGQFQRWLKYQRRNKSPEHERLRKLAGIKPPENFKRPKRY